MTERLYRLKELPDPATRARELVARLRQSSPTQDSWECAMELISLVPDLITLLDSEREARDFWRLHAKDLEMSTGHSG